MKHPFSWVPSWKLFRPQVTKFQGSRAVVDTGKLEKAETCLKCQGSESLRNVLSTLGKALGLYRVERWGECVADWGHTPRLILFPAPSARV